MSFRQKNIYLRTMALYSGKTDKLRPPAPDLVRLPSLRGTKQSRNRLNFAMTAKQSRNRLNLAMTAKQSVLLNISAPHTTKMGGGNSLIHSVLRFSYLLNIYISRTGSASGAAFLLRAAVIARHFPVIARHFPVIARHSPVIARHFPVIARYSPVIARYEAISLLQRRDCRASLAMTLLICRT